MNGRKRQTSLQALTRAANVLSQAMELRHCKQADIASALRLLSASNPVLIVWLRDKLAEAVAGDGNQQPSSDAVDPVAPRGQEGPTRDRKTDDVLP